MGDVSLATGVPKQTVSRLLRQIDGVGAVERVPDGIVVCPSLVFGAWWPAAEIGAVAAPALSVLYARTGATVLVYICIEGSPVRDGLRKVVSQGGSSGCGGGLLAGVPPTLAGRNPG